MADRLLEPGRPITADETSPDDGDDDEALPEEEGDMTMESLDDASCPAGEVGADGDDGRAVDTGGGGWGSH